MKYPDYTDFTSTASEMAMKFAKGQVEILDMLATSAKGTPAAPLFDFALQMQHSALEGLESLATAAKAAPSEAKSKKAAKPVKAAASAMKKAVDAQADLLVKASTEANAAAAKTKDTVRKAAKSAASGDMKSLYDDLTVVSGIGPSTMKKLQAAGIRTVEDIAKTTKKDLTAIIEEANIRVLKFTPADWIADAKALLKSAKAA